MPFVDTMLLTTIVVVYVTCVSGFGQFRDRIPNGRHIGHPCRQGQAWDGVGHQSPAGGGPRNLFGLAFNANRKMWTVDLCKEDSDGDNYTNGEELGDPDCTWTMRSTPSRSINITHPGICEPWDSVKCKQLNGGWVEDVCTSPEFHCPALHKTDVQPYTIRLNRTLVPEKKSTYVCQIFRMTEDQDLHLVAATPVLDKQNILHHMFIFGCDPTKQDSELGHATDTPFECGYQPSQNCKDVLVGWTLGMEGMCMPEQAGFRIGMKGYTRLALQLHWTNPEHVKTYTDSSGMNIFLTRKLRPYDAGTFMTGQFKLAIPPRESVVSVEGGCLHECSKEILLGPINITGALNRMQHLGQQQYLDVVRGGERVKLAHEPHFQYDSPILHQLKEPIVVNPGDELSTRCVFNSMSKKTTTVFGTSKSTELCVSFLFYYPKQNVKRSRCLQRGTISSCEMESGSIRGCDVHQLTNNPMNPIVMTALATVRDNCDPFGDCRKECKEAVISLKRAQPCLRGDVWKYIKRTFLDNKGFTAFKPIMMEFFAGLSLAMQR